MEKRYPIRRSTWTVDRYTVDNRKKPQERIVLERIMVAGEQSDLLAISRSRVYLRRVYKRVFKKNFDTALYNNLLKVVKISLDDKTYGLGKGNIEEAQQIRQQEGKNR